MWMYKEMYMEQKRQYKFEVIGAEVSNEGISEGVSNYFHKLSKAKKFVEKYYNDNSNLKCFNISNYSSINVILKISTSNDESKYIKKVWIYRNNKWFSTRNIKKYTMLMEY